MYVLYYAPDNASLIIRLALDHIGVPYRTALVDRTTRAQDSPTYRALNPNGLIPALETPDGVLFETGAILLWLADRHGGLGPAPMDPARGGFLKWLFFTSNTLHPALQMIFYTEKYTGPEAVEILRAHQRDAIMQHLATLDTHADQWRGENVNALHFYVAACLRWCALYPTGSDRSWFRLADYPVLHAICTDLETLPCTAKLCAAEGMTPAPFTAPDYPHPPEGSPT